MNSMLSGYNKELENKKTGIEGWEDREQAIEVIYKAKERYNK